MATLIDVLALGLAMQKAQAECTPESVYSSIEYAEVARRADTATAELPILRNVQALDDKGKDNGKPIGESLSVEDNVRFQYLTDMLNAIQLNSYIESDHARDAEVTYKNGR